jgi:hypothetical protein
MEFTLNFNEMECKRFLIKEGYTIERYHGIVEDDFFHTLEGLQLYSHIKKEKIGLILINIINDQYQLNNAKSFNEK